MDLNYSTPIQYLKGVGPKIAGLLAKRGISNVKDFLEWYPRAYEDRRQARNIKSLVPGELVSLVATVRGVRTQPLGRTHRKVYTVLVGDESGIISCKFFRTPYRGYFERFQAGTKIRVVGRTSEYRGVMEFHHPEIRDFEEEENADSIIPIYTETEGLPPRKLRGFFDLALSSLKGQHPDVFPDWMKEKYELVSREEAITGLHHPPQDASHKFLSGRTPFHRRIIFEEFFWLELYLAARKAGIKKEKGIAFKAVYEDLTRFRLSLPFELTNAQKRAFKEILADMQLESPMHRLVQGDVGSGKTVVAFLSAIFAASNGFQTAIMVPTEILAGQHYKNAVKMLEPLGFRVGLLTGSMKASEKKKMYADLASGEVTVCIGTHALIQEDVDFKMLGLVIIDEQHRFGVGQRHLLKKKGIAPHFMVMTATPIPRTLAMTVYGDMDVSVIDELPKGRQSIETKVFYDNKKAVVLKFLEEQVRAGRQAYVVYPLVEESEKMDLKNAVEEYETLAAQFSQIRFGLLHGRMKDIEKEEIMLRFRARELDVLVATTVIEVGVDVPNANLMMIEHAERFGLSQLHQLRGRVGRGEFKSYCYLMLAGGVSEEGRQRLSIMARTNNGFEIAEEDFKIRGPGEILGTRQSGMAGFKMASLVTDTDIMMEAREAAFDIIHQDPTLSLPEHAGLREELLRAHGPTALASVG